MISLKIDWFDLCCPKDSQKSSPGPEFECINSLMLCLLYGPVLTTVSDPWDDYGLDNTDLCQESNVFAI